MSRRLAPLACSLALLAGTPALAHPHVFINARAEILYAPDGKVMGLRHRWTFDKGYSAFITQGLDKNGDGKLTPDELQDLAKENTESLVDFEYFTVVKANGAKQDFSAPTEYAMSFEAGEATLTYVLPLKTPANASRMLAVEIADPTYFVAFAMPEGNGSVSLASAPKGCAVTVTGPKTIDVAATQNLSESFFEALTAASDFGQQFANRVIVACP